MSRVAALVLAAGRGARMSADAAAPSKLLATIDGVSLVRRAVVAANASRADPVVVVLGHQSTAIEAALGGLEARCMVNADHAAGLSGSLAIGIRALRDDAVDGVLVMLADMPFVAAALLDELVAAFEKSGGPAIVAPVHDGRRGNPVLWPRRFFPALGAITGDRGARDLILRYRAELVTIEAGEGALIDLDTPEALATHGGISG